MCAVGGAQNLKNFSKCQNLDESLYDFGIHSHDARKPVVKIITYSIYDQWDLWIVPTTIPP